MTRPEDTTPRPAPFSEKGFYLAEFRGRTLALALPAAQIGAPGPLEEVLKELEANDTRVVLIGDEREALEGLAGTPVLAPAPDGRAGAVWRAFAGVPRVGVTTDPGRPFALACREIAQDLGVSKLLWVDREGGLRHPDGSRSSFVDLEQLSVLLGAGAPGQVPGRLAILREVEELLRSGLPAVTLCSVEGLGDELFTYAGSGTLFTCERYVLVRRLGLDDFDAANDLVARGVAEGFLTPRRPEEIERVLAHGFGAFVEGRYLAGIGALLVHAGSRSGEIASLYTLTRFLGEGVGDHLVTFALERARGRELECVFACTTSERVVRFFERHGFQPVDPEALPAERWVGYDPERRRRVRCLRHAL